MAENWLNQVASPRMDVIYATIYLEKEKQTEMLFDFSSVNSKRMFKSQIDSRDINSFLMYMGLTKNPSRQKKAAWS